MSVTVTCPECDDRYEVSDSAAEQMIRCRRCQCPIDPPRRGPASEGIQVKPILTPAATSNRHEEDDPEFDLPRRHPTPKSRFPWVALLVIIIGLLFFLLAFSVGFNFWFLSHPENRLRMEAAQQAQQVAIQQQRIEAEKAAEVALVAEKQAREIQVAAGKEADRLPWGTLEGRVIWKGELPKIADLEPRIRDHAEAHLLKGPKEQMLDPTWRIDPKTRGVGNVAVFIKRPKNGLLQIHPNDRVRKESVVLDMPFAAFVPHVAALYLEWNDGKDRGQTGQKFVVRNSSPLARNARATGMPPHNDGFNKNFPPGAEEQFPLNPQRVPVSVVCDVHPWMQAYAWVFDHPYYAITKADGSFTIPRVPADMEVQVMAWHEGQGWLFTKEGRTMKLNKGKNTLDFEMSEEQN